MMDTYVERQPVSVLRLRADFSRGGPAEAFRRIEAKLPSLRGRHFYGTIQLAPDGEEYYACAERTPGDDPRAMGLEVGTIPGGLYARRKVYDWERVIAEGRLVPIFSDLVQTHHVDASRPDVEYYRSKTELHLLVPVTGK